MQGDKKGAWVISIVVDAVSGFGATESVTEGTVRYHLRRHRQGDHDGRADQPHLASAHAEAITRWIESRGTGPLNVAALHDHLQEEHRYTGSLRSVQRFVRTHYPTPARRARRRVETPPGAQAQADWSEWRDVWIGGRRERLYAFELQLSYSRYAVRVWSRRKDQLSWHHVHNEALRRLEGVPATIRVDNERTAVSRGAGWTPGHPRTRVPLNTLPIVLRATGWSRCLRATRIRAYSQLGFSSAIRTMSSRISFMTPGLSTR